MLLIVALGIDSEDEKSLVVKTLNYRESNILSWNRHYGNSTWLRFRTLFNKHMRYCCICKDPVYPKLDLLVLKTKICESVIGLRSLLNILRIRSTPKAVFFLTIVLWILKGLNLRWEPHAYPQGFSKWMGKYNRSKSYKGLKHRWKIMCVKVPLNSLWSTLQNKNNHYLHWNIYELMFYAFQCMLFCIWDKFFVAIECTKSKCRQLDVSYASRHTEESLHNET